MNPSTMDHNDDPFADLVPVPDTTLVSPLEYGSGITLLMKQQQEQSTTTTLSNDDTTMIKPQNVKDDDHDHTEVTQESVDTMEDMEKDMELVDEPVAVPTTTTNEN